ncbi:hypothetical protein D7Z54_17295 [Salibacterium salarium]|uniref:Uncharacterized protein n=1 Tax=Salibacterium salarium TaxID=284579 RepID=A0A3R9QJM3_9BACI|nr:hypothetical protein D7Z54_17295 [Salibacterium salarium]
MQEGSYKERIPLFLPLFSEMMTDRPSEIENRENKQEISREISDNKNEKYSFSTEYDSMLPDK